MGREWGGGRPGSRLGVPANPGAPPRPRAPACAEVTEQKSVLSLIKVSATHAAAQQRPRGPKVPAVSLSSPSLQMGFPSRGSPRSGAGGALSWDFSPCAPRAAPGPARSCPAAREATGPPPGPSPLPDPRRFLPPQSGASGSGQSGEPSSDPSRTPVRASSSDAAAGPSSLGPTGRGGRGSARRAGGEHAGPAALPPPQSARPFLRGTVPGRTPLPTPGPPGEIGKKSEPLELVKKGLGSALTRRP